MKLRHASILLAAVLTALAISLILFACVWAQSTSTAFTAYIAVDATRPGPRVPADLWGTNLPQRADAARTVEISTFVTLTRQIGIPLIRWPGGNNADAYDWKRDEEIRPGRRVSLANDVDLARILRFARDTGAQLSITVNFGTMSAQDAADLVEFLNGPADSAWGARRAALGFPEPLGVRYFEVGNEIGQPHMWYYAWTAEDPVKYFFGGAEERRGFYNNVGSKEYDPLGAKGDFFKATGGPNQTYTLRFPPVRDVRVFWAASQEDIQNRVYEEWHQVDDLSTQPPDAKVFTLDAAQGVLRFGDGVHGAMPPANSYFLVEYTTYGHDGFVAIARAMRAAPSNVPILIGAAMLPFVDGQPITGTAGMRAIFEQMDFYVRHQYGSRVVKKSSSQVVMQSGSRVVGQSTARLLDYSTTGLLDYSPIGLLRQIPLDRVDHLTGVYQRVRQYAESLGLDVPEIAVTEWNVFLDRQYWHINRTQMGAVIAAEWFARLLNARDSLPVRYANQFALGGGNLALIRSQGTYSLAPMAYVFQGFRDWPGSRVLPVNVQSPTAPAYDREVPYITAAAARSNDGRTLRLALVNNAITEIITTTLHITGFVPASARVWRLAADDPLAGNDHQTPQVTPDASILPALPGALALPPHSVTFLTLQAPAVRLHLPLLTHRARGGPVVSRHFGITITGEGFYDFNCERARSIAAGATWFVLPWPAVQPQPDRWTFEAADALVDAARACGLDVGLKLRTGYDHWGVKPGGNGRGSMPPRDLDAYRTWVKTVAAHFRGRVRAYAIENEVNAPAFWAGTFEEYKALWPVGYAAVKAGDPDALVVNFAMTSPRYGTAIARWRYEHGDLEGAITWLNRYLERRANPRVQSEEELKAWIYEADAQHDYEIMMWQFSAQPRPDVYQLHFYEAWDLLPEVMAWVRERMHDEGYEIPIEVWEIGYYWADDASYREDVHGLDVAKLLLTALGEGAPRVYYLPYRSLRAAQGKLETVRGLVNVDWSPRPAHAAYRRVVTTVGDFASADRLQAGPDRWCYYFDRLLACWTQDSNVVFSR